MSWLIGPESTFFRIESVIAKRLLTTLTRMGRVLPNMILYLLGCKVSFLIWPILHLLGWEVSLLIGLDTTFTKQFLGATDVHVRIF